MTFPSLGCRTCKQRRVKCDEARPTCKRCQKAKLVCKGVEQNETFIFLNENEYAVGRRKRPRGPNLNSTTSSTRENTPIPASDTPKGPPKSLDNALRTTPPPTEPRRLSLSPTLDFPLNDKALTYYHRYYLEVPQNLPEITDSHLKHVLADNCYSQPQSIISLSILAVSHATFGRAQRSHAALAVASSKYSKALLRTNLALKDAYKSTHDEILLAVMLLSFYENSVMDKTSSSSRDSGIQAIASPSFAHHDGAMAVLNLRRKLDQRTDYSMELDKLVRRQLMRSLLLRNLPIPFWLRDGSKYGEQGFALELDRCMVIAAKLRHQASSISIDAITLSASDGYDNTAKGRRLLAEAKALDDVLSVWAHDLLSENRYSVCTVQDDGSLETGSRVFDRIFHVYPTVGHAGMWNRYRALRLTANDIILKTLSFLATKSPGLDPETDSLEETTKLGIEHLTDDLCASIPYMLGLLKKHPEEELNITVATKAPTSLKTTVKATTASLLCWPLAMASTVSGIPERHRRYLKDRLLDVSEIVDDGVLEEIALRFYKE